MFPKVSRLLLLAVLLPAGWPSGIHAQELPGLEFSINNGQQQLRFGPFPSADTYKVFRADSLDKPFVEDASGILSGFTWTAPFRADALGFYTVQPVPMSNNDLLAGIVLNRLAYGQTPDELERVKAIGPQAYIQEQLAPEGIEENLDIDQPSPIPATADWKFFSVTGTAGNTNFYVYLNVPGEGWIDDIKLVKNTVPSVNLIRNGDFETPLTSVDWNISPNMAGSTIDTTVQHSGSASLHLAATSGGTTLSSAIWQALHGFVLNSAQYTLSYWYLQSTTELSSPTVRMSTDTGLRSVPYPVSAATKLAYGGAKLEDLRMWHVARAVRSKKQLLEVLLQFFENHFVTQQEKSMSFFDDFYKDDGIKDQIATSFEYKENKRWREALLNSSCTFYDLLKISAESPAMIIFLDTVTSRGDGSNVANENYARELLELFDFGVDNGYDQTDIVQTSKAWTGWRLAMVNPQDESNPLAKPLFDPDKEARKATNNFGVWALNYRSQYHNNAAKKIFAGKTVPARFGAPYAGRSYELALPARSGAAGMQDGYDVIQHIANQPFTQEFISAKLCRLFVHDDFVHGVYDYTAADLSPETKLVKACMDAWENSNPKGSIRAVLATIFNSDLFRGTTAASQKIKNPLEFTVSAIRALRAQNADGTFTADTDGNVTTELGRLGNMKLFDRAEPDGYPEAGPAWISAGTLSERLRFVQSLVNTTAQRANNNDAGNSVADPVAVLKLKVPSGSWHDAEAVAGYFVSILYPTEGKANLDLYRSSAVTFLDTADGGAATSLFSGLSMTGNPSPYEKRVRGMVGLLLSFQRFHEQ